MHQTNLYASEQRGHSCSVCWQAAQEVGYDGCRGDWGFQHANEWISVDGLNNLCLLFCSNSQCLPASDGRPDSRSESCCSRGKAGPAAQPDAGGRSHDSLSSHLIHKIGDDNKVQAESTNKGGRHQRKRDFGHSIRNQSGRDSPCLIKPPHLHSFGARVAENTLAGLRI